MTDLLIKRASEKRGKEELGLREKRDAATDANYSREM